MDYLIDCDQKEKRFRIKSLLVSGDHYEVALVEDTFDDDRVLCAKSIAYDYDRIDDREYIEGRHQALEAELDFLKLGIEELPVPVEWLNVESEEDELDVEPVLVMTFKPGHTLEQIVEVEGPLEPERVRSIAHDLLLFLKQVHDHGWVFRNLHPSHIVAAADGSLSIIGSGNATRQSEPPNLTKRIQMEAYLAPEIRSEVGGSTLRPPADLYSFGALLSYLLTAEHPRAVVENPLSETAYHHLTNLKPEGLALIIAKCMAPMAKNRFPSVDELLPYLERGNLPTPSTPGFGLVLLAAPWSGAEHPTNRSLQSKLSAGPLISVPQEPSPAPPAPEKKKSRLAVIFIVLILFVFGLIVLGSVLSFPD